jgi:1-acyl-sn-glycerol-3-phosphate acyltransferase
MGMGKLRAIFILLIFLSATLPAMLLQLVYLRLGLKRARTFPHSYHKFVSRLLGVRLHITGAVDPSRPALLVSNHVSWLDIVVLSAVAPLSFVAKAEVGTWPFISWLAKLQRTVFVDRTRRVAVKDKASEIGTRLAQGDTIVLFAEGTSGDGNKVLPFKSSLFSAVGLAPGESSRAVVQTVTLTYTHVHGLPILRHERPLIAWYGDMEMMGHIWRVLKMGPVDVQIRIGEPVSLTGMRDRKKLAAFSERRVRHHYIEQLTARPRTLEPA